MSKEKNLNFASGIVTCPIQRSGGAAIAVWITDPRGQINKQTKKKESIEKKNGKTFIPNREFKRRKGGVSCSS